MQISQAYKLYIAHPRFDFNVCCVFFFSFHTPHAVRPYSFKNSISACFDILWRTVLRKQTNKNSHKWTDILCNMCLKIDFDAWKSDAIIFKKDVLSSSKNESYSTEAIQYLIFFSSCVVCYWRKNSCLLFICAECNTKIYSENVMRKEKKSIMSTFYFVQVQKQNTLLFFFFFTFLFKGWNSLKPYFCKEILATAGFSGEKSGAWAMWELIGLK